MIGKHWTWMKGLQTLESTVHVMGKASTNPGTLVASEPWDPIWHYMCAVSCTTFPYRNYQTQITSKKYKQYMFHYHFCMEHACIVSYQMSYYTTAFPIYHQWVYYSWHTFYLSRNCISNNVISLVINMYLPIINYTVIVQMIIGKGLCNKTIFCLERAWSPK